MNIIVIIILHFYTVTKHKCLTYLDSHLKIRLNHLVQRFLEHGHFKYFERQTDTIMKISAISKIIHGIFTSKVIQSISLKELEFIFYFYLVAILVSVIVFIKELLCAINV